jgi:hypothetical protein
VGKYTRGTEKVKKLGYDLTEGKFKNDGVDGKNGCSHKKQ